MMMKFCKNCKRELIITKDFFSKENKYEHKDRSLISKCKNPMPERREE